jgi:hopanoid-associated phosphorylase
LLTAPLVVVGLRREARIVDAPGMRILIGGGQSQQLAQALGAAVAEGATSMVSFGLCGGLAPGLSAGDLVVDSSDPDWLAEIRAALPRSRAGRVIGLDAVVASVGEKARLRRGTGADAVDMESHLVVDAARRAQVRYAIIRAVSDPADRALPRAAIVGMRPDGGVDVAAVVAALARRPWELASLLRIAGDAGRAFKSLSEARTRLGPALGAYSAASR